MIETTYYIRDAQGNVMATYLNKNEGSAETYHLTERPIYGSSRLGMLREKVNMLASLPEADAMRYMRYGLKHYELTNHLGNVTTILTAQKVPFYENTFLTYKPQIVQSMDYSPFGVTRLSYDVTPVDANNPVDEGYRYGFQGQEKDDEIKGAGNSINYKYRMHDPRIGRFFAVDPLSSKYPYYSPYAFSGNDVIRSVELEGLEPVPASEIWRLGKYTTASVTAKDIDYETSVQFAKIHAETVLLVGIKSGPNKGNFAGFTLGEGLGTKDFYDVVQGKNTQVIDAQLSFVIGAERVPNEALAGDLGPVATGSGIKALSSEYELSSSLSGLTGVDQSNAVGQGYYSETTGEWVSTFSTNEALKEIGINWLSNMVDPSNYGPSHFLIKGRGSFAGMTKFKIDTKGTYRGSNEGNLPAGYLRSNPSSQSQLDAPVPEPASTEEIQQR